MILKPTWDNYQYRSFFTGFDRLSFSHIVDTVWVMFSGVLECWAIIPLPLRDEKRKQAMDLLVAWYTMQMYPEQTLAATGVGSMPLAAKKIDDVYLKFKSIVQQEGVLDTLTTNQFGIQFLLLFQTAPENFTLFI